MCKTRSNLLHQIKKYIQFLFHASNQHGVHSPFIFEFVTTCLYDKTVYTAYKRLSEYRKSLLRADNSIFVTDFGAGSRVFKSNTRKVAAIAKHAGATRKRMNLLYRVSRFFEPKNTLELGTSLGMASFPLALGTSGNLETVEGCKNTLAIAEEKLESFDLKNILYHHKSFSAFLERVDGKTYDLIYFDGNHSKAATLAYFNALLPTAHNNSVWIFDDLYWSAPMTDAWETIKNHPSVTVTVDCFWLGFVFFRKEQAAQHFKIRL